MDNLKFEIMNNKSALCLADVLYVGIVMFGMRVHHEYDFCTNDILLLR
jgi:hypothetical protein